MSQNMAFNKVPKANNELAELLVSRGLAAEREILAHILDAVGYYRFTGYLVPFKLPNSDNYRPGILMTLKNARNICAHHSRFWNKRTKSRITKRMGRNPELAALEECFSRQTSFNYTTTFTVLSLCAYCMGIIRPESKWKDRCRELLRTATPFILRGMGAPADWESLALWKD